MDSGMFDKKLFNNEQVHVQKRIENFWRKSEEKWVPVYL
jgi:hypothetical protein